MLVVLNKNCFLINIYITIFLIMSSNQQFENESVAIFREYLQIPTVQPNVDYSLFSVIFLLNILIQIINKK